MESICRELITVLTEQKDKYHQLMALAAQKRRYLISGDLANLNETIKEEEGLIFSLGKLEGEREKCFTRLSTQAELEPEQTLGEILPQLPPPCQEELAQIQAEFGKLVEDLTRLNQENTSLCEQALQFVNFTVEAISQQTKPLYNADQEVKVAQISNIVDKKV